MQDGYPTLEGLRIGHASDYGGITGCTVILAEEGMVAGVDVRGGASGTIELGVLDPLHLTPKAHAIVLSGGSAFGLEASCGVRRALEAAGIGFPVRDVRVPIVAGAILFDLGIGKGSARPGREMGEAATAAAFAAKPADLVAEGCVGAGTGATIGKINGLNFAMKGGLGHSVLELGGRFRGIRVSAIVAVNAFGDVWEKSGEKILAGARKPGNSLDFENAVKKLLDGGISGSQRGENTTIGAVLTNATLTKLEATKVSQMAQAGLLQRVRPAHTAVDGDTLFCASTGRGPSADVNALGVAAAEAVSDAVERAVKRAWRLGDVPALQDFSV